MQKTEIQPNFPCFVVRNSNHTDWFGTCFFVQDFSVLICAAHSVSDSVPYVIEDYSSGLQHKLTVITEFSIQPTGDCALAQCSDIVAQACSANKQVLTVTESIDYYRLINRSVNVIAYDYEENGLTEIQTTILHTGKDELGTYIELPIRGKVGFSGAPVILEDSIVIAIISRQSPEFPHCIRAYCIFRA